MGQTLYRRPLPAEAIEFSSPEGRRIFAEALAASELDGYFRLAEQFHTQSDPAFCGLGSLVVALNALAIDPGRLWKGPWRWFAEDLLDCCVPLSTVRERGLDVDELACLARCNGAEVTLCRADASDAPAFREALRGAADGGSVVVVAYDRARLGQTGSGHFSPIGGFHSRRDLALVLDVARFKYPPHWVPVERLFHAMESVDPATGRARGFMTLRARRSGLALGFSLRCDGESWSGLAGRLGPIVGGIHAHPDLAALARAVAPLTANVELRIPTAPTHEQELVEARAALRALPGYGEIEAAVGAYAEAVTALLLAMAERLPARLRSSLEPVEQRSAALANELANLRAQLEAMGGAV